jgi:hypothetical protein
MVSRVARALAGEPYDPEKDPNLQYWLGFLDGCLTGLLYLQKHKRSRGRPKNNGAGKWNYSRYTQLWADIELLKSRNPTLSDVAACQYIERNQKRYSARYPKEKAGTLRRRYADAKKLSHNPAAEVFLNRSWNDWQQAIVLFVLKKNHALDYTKTDHDHDVAGIRAMRK